MIINQAYEAFNKYHPDIRVSLPLACVCLLIDATDPIALSEDEKRKVVSYIQSQLDAGCKTCRRGYHPIPESE